MTGDRETGPSGQRDAGVIFIGSRHGGGGPAVLQGLRKPAFELADIPGTGDIHREIPAAELLVKIGDLGFRYGRGISSAEQVEIEVKGPAEGVALEIAEPGLVAKQFRP